MASVLRLSEFDFPIFGKKYIVYTLSSYCIWTDQTLNVLFKTQTISLLKSTV
jgi:hypothetical protein